MDSCSIHIAVFCNCELDQYNLFLQSFFIKIYDRSVYMDYVNTPGYNNRYRNIAYLTKNNNENKPLSTTMDARSERYE